MGIDNKKKTLLVIFVFILFLFFFFYPVTLVDEEDYNIRIFSTSLTKVIFYDDIQYTFKEKTIFFYEEIPFEEFILLNVQNGFLLRQNGDSLVQKQSNDSSAMVYLKNKNTLYNLDNVFYNEKWLENWIIESKDFLENVSEIDEPLYILYMNQSRSFQVLPSVYVVNSIKDLVHELSHYFFGYKVKASPKDTWHEILAETNSLLFLREVSSEQYFEELELKKTGFYDEPYGESVISFMERLDFDKEKIFDIERYILNNFDRLDDKRFENLVETKIKQ
ncbi:hypothetical protein X928_01275 [Petrotoga miotherma DSM 10691]|uniref:Peptidase MA-like domain-containing protein n=1 Tax=Petrotoga miotherma DSM 10691 TaxID=1434326 RepID=A0A2K1PH28_9BACT|nr:hypothetical protein [Petrotoga miotherma]PNS02095.1 hypothetical protein X928_01275 [Petrotoga miotherma DSM 10691]